MHKITISVLVDDPELMPVYGTSLASGADAKARLSEPVVLEPGATALIPTGLRVEIPEGYEIQVRPRSGFALKHQITVLNTPGTIDADYRGEICVILINHGKQPFTILPKMKIAQLVVSAVVQAEFMPQELLTATKRGEGGFGHTGA